MTLPVKKASIYMAALFITAMLLTPAFARGPGMASEECPMQDNAQVSISFNKNNQKGDAIQVTNILNTMMTDVEALAKEAGISDIVMQSKNYSVNSYNNSSECGGDGDGVVNFNMNGSVTYNISPADKAESLMILLTKKGYSASFNVNSYRQCQ